MAPLPCTTIAGRHAADVRRRGNAQDQTALQDSARHELERVVRLYGLATRPHFARELETERSLWIDCRLATAERDHQLVYAILADLGWKPDRTRLSRTRVAYDVLRMIHARTGATLVVIIKLPVGDFEPLEAA